MQNFFSSERGAGRIGAAVAAGVVAGVVVVAVGGGLLGKRRERWEVATP